MLQQKAAKIVTLSLAKSEEGSISNFQCNQINYFPKFEDFLQPNIFLYHIDFVDGELIGEVARRRSQKYDKIVNFLRYNNQISYASNINKLYNASRFITCDTFFSKFGNLESQMFTYSKPVKMYTQRMFNNLEKLFLTIKMHFTYPTKKSKVCWKTWPFLILSKFVFKKRTDTRRQRLRVG